MNEREQALQLVSRATPPLQQIDTLYNTALNLNQQYMAAKAREQAGNGKKGTVLGIVGAFVIYIILDIIYRTGVFSFLGTFWPVIYIVAAFTITIYSFFFIRKKIGNDSRKSDAVAQRLGKEIDDLSAEVERIAMEQADNINALPPDYRYYYAAQFLYQALSNGRADSMKEALNLYEEHLHRQTLENQGQQMLYNSRQQSVMLSNIEANSRAAANGAQTAAVFSILNFMR